MEGWWTIYPIVESSRRDMRELFRRSGYLPIHNFDSLVMITHMPKPIPLRPTLRVQRVEVIV